MCGGINHVTVPPLTHSPHGPLYVSGVVTGRGHLPMGRKEERTGSRVARGGADYPLEIPDPYPIVILLPDNVGRI